jgi:hypothetical protein
MRLAMNHVTIFWMQLLVIFGLKIREDEEGWHRSVMG